MIKLERIDHFVMRVADVGATCSFYEKVLGMEVITFNGKDGVVRKALRFGDLGVRPAFVVDPILLWVLRAGGRSGRT